MGKSINDNQERPQSEIDPIRAKMLKLVKADNGHISDIFFTLEKIWHAAELLSSHMLIDDDPEEVMFEYLRDCCDWEHVVAFLKAQERAGYYLFDLTADEFRAVVGYVEE